MKMILAAAMFAAVTTAAAAQSPMASSAQSPMATDAMAGVPKSAKAKITKCTGMAHDAMMANATCTKMMKLYPAAFSGSVSTN